MHLLFLCISLYRLGASTSGRLVYIFVEWSEGRERLWKSLLVLLNQYSRCRTEASLGALNVFKWSRLFQQERHQCPVYPFEGCFHSFIAEMMAIMRERIMNGELFRMFLSVFLLDLSELNVHCRSHKTDWLLRYWWLLAIAASRIWLQDAVLCVRMWCPRRLIMCGMEVSPAIYKIFFCGIWSLVSLNSTFCGSLLILVGSQGESRFDYFSEGHIWEGN